MKKIIYIVSCLMVAVLLASCGTQAASSSYPQNLPPTFGATNSSQVGSASASSDAETKGSVASSVSSSGAKQAGTNDGTIDLDLTELSSTMVYAEVYTIMVDPESYFGKNIKMKGNLAVYEDFETGEYTFAVVIADATACCSQGLEFVLEGDYTYPQDYPEKGSEITVIGQMQPYDYNGFNMFHLENAYYA